MMVIVLIAGVSLSWPIRRANVQRRAVAALRTAHSSILFGYDFQYSADGTFKRNASLWAPALLRRITGDEFFQEVASVGLFEPVSEITWACLEEFERLRVLHIRDSSVRDFGRMFKQAAGQASSLVRAAPRCSRRWFQGKAAARVAFL
jgi:hypothetical protein